MTDLDISEQLRVKDLYHHIDMGFLNTRLCWTSLPETFHQRFTKIKNPGTGHLADLQNQHNLVTLILDYCELIKAPTLLQALRLDKPSPLFRSTERLAPCPQIYDSSRVCHAVELDLNFDKPVFIAYHTNHIVSDTGKMTLSKGFTDKYVHSIVGLLHDRPDRFEIEPMVIGAPLFDHPRNGEDCHELAFIGDIYGEIQPEDIEEFSKMRDVKAENADEWMSVMEKLPEKKVKDAFAGLFSEPTKKDWGGELNDHFSANVMFNGRRNTAAFLLKGPSQFREMTLDMCGTRADQIHRMVDSRADLSVVQHSHLIGSVVRRTLRALVIVPGGCHRKYCIIDGQATYRILKAYSLI